MNESPEARGAIRLDTRKLRKIAYDLANVGNDSRRLTDQIVIDALLDSHQSVSATREDLVSAALLLANQYEIEFDPVRDVWTTDNERKELAESFWRRIVAKQTGRPWVFILSYADNQASAVHEDVHGVSYGFHEGVTTWRGIVASGPGSYVVFYNTSNAPKNPMCYTGVARIRSIEERPLSTEGKRTWRAHLEEFHEIHPVAAADIAIPGRNVQHGIQAISWTSFREITELGGFHVAEDEPQRNRLIVSRSERGQELDYELAAERGPDFVIPQSTSGELRPSPTHSYAPGIDREQERVSNSMPQGNRERDLNKLTEVRAVEIATVYLASKGWALKHDRQLDGAGYDLEFQRDESTLYVEVKGIRGSDLAFNMTAKEWHQCLNLRGFVLIAVTGALDNETFKIHVLWPEQICRLQRVITQFRLKSVD